MQNKTVSALLLTLLLLSILTFNIQPVRATGTIYIRPDGTVEGTDKIQRDGDLYTFTDNIYDRIVIERENIIVDGNNYNLQGTGTGNGVFINRIDNVTIRNINIIEFNKGIETYDIYYCNITGNTFSSNTNAGISFVEIVIENIVEDNFFYNNHVGIHLTPFYDISNNIIANNTFADNDVGLEIDLTANNVAHDNFIYHNNFIANTQQVHIIPMFPGWPAPFNHWDDGYPSGGNYWSDYTGVDLYSGPDQDQLGSDGIGDTSYIVDDNNIDHYPLSSPFPQTPDFDIVVSPSTGTTDQGTTVTTNVYVSAIAGYDYLVSLSASGEPEGVTIDFNPNTGTPDFTSTMTIQVGYYVPLNVYPITVTGLGSDDTTHSTTYTLTVIPAVPEFPLGAEAAAAIGLMAAVAYIWLRRRK